MAGRCRWHQPVDRVRNFDLAGKPAPFPDIEGEIEHVFFHFGRLARFIAPGFVNVDVASRARASPPALRLDTGNVVELGGLHDR